MPPGALDKPLKSDEAGFLDICVACVTHITQNLDGFNPEEFVRKSSVYPCRPES